VDSRVAVRNDSKSTHDERPKGRLASFLVIGDWGWDEKAHGNINSDDCQKAIQTVMHQQFEKLGDVEFVLNVGDSFYPAGLRGRDDEQIQTKWRDIYSPDLRSVPWLSVYGNHDYHVDACSCTRDEKKCYQHNDDIHDLSRFYMPGTSYHRVFERLGTEVVALDLNEQQWAFDPNAADKVAWDCEWTKCKDKCEDIMRERAEASYELFKRRSDVSSAKNLLVFSHYPTDYLLEGSAAELLGGLRNNTKHNIVYFGGHRHNTDNWSTTPTTPNSNWLVGGGGGWSCQPDTLLTPQQQGIVVGEIYDDFSIRTYAILVDKSKCCSSSSQG